MASETDRRTADFEEVKAALAQHPAIRVVQVEGEPPDLYEIEYRLAGLVRNPDGTVRKASQHVVQISLPFGYPHFPPAAKPLTPIFHPDIDPDAVRIAAHWQQQPSLAQLILHIGEMISGRSYSLEDPFNQEAADWYSEHAAELPLDGPAPTADDGLGLGLELDLGPAETASEHGSEGPDLELEIAPQPDVQEDIRPKLDELRAHISRKEMTIAARLLAGLPASGSPELEAMRRTVRAALEERDQLLQKLKVLEDEDNFAEAEDVFKKIKKIAVDTPGLAEIGRRLQQSKTLLDTFSVKEEPSAEKKEPQEEEQKKKPAAKKAKEPPPKEPEVRERLTGGRAKVARSAGRNLPSPPALIAVALAVTILGGGMLYTRDVDRLREARRIWREAGYLADQKKFGEAELKANNTLDMLDSILIPGLGQSSLENEISALLASNEFKIGLEGKGTYKGQVLPLAELEKRNELDRLTALAEALAQSGKIKEAVPAYEEAWKSAAKNGFTAEAQSLEDQMQTLSMQVAVDTLGRELDQSMKEALEAFKRELEQSQKSFTGAQWQKVVEMLERALQLLDKNSMPVPPEKRQELKHLLVRARLYQLLTSARQSYESKEFAAAVSAYRQALQLLKDNQAMFGETYSDSAEKISRTMAGIEIGSERRAAAEAEQKKDIETAGEHYRKLLDLLSSAGAGPQDVNIVKAKIDDLNAAAAMIKKKDWLNRNFERIFRDAYPPASSSSVLSNPSLTLIKKINGLELYTLSCSEMSQGSSYRLELKYQYNPAANQWSPSTGQ